MAIFAPQNPGFADGKFFFFKIRKSFQGDLDILIHKRKGSALMLVV